MGVASALVKVVDFQGLGKGRAAVRQYIISFHAFLVFVSMHASKVVIEYRQAKLASALKHACSDSCLPDSVLSACILTKNTKCVKKEIMYCRTAARPFPKPWKDLRFLRCRGLVEMYYFSASFAFRTCVCL